MNWRPDPGHLALLQEFIRSRVAAGDSDQDIRDRLVVRRPGYRAALERMRAAGVTDDEIRSYLDWWWTLEFGSGQTTIPDYIETARLLASSGPTAIDGLTVETIRETLVGWTDAWPPTQDALADEMQVSARRLRQVLHDAGMSWNVLVAEAAEKRK